jgi:hypothetical protein
MGIPSLEYTNRYSWGYFGITFDGVNLNKPEIERSYTGSDLYSDSLINALQNQVLFESDMAAPPVGGATIFPDNTSPNATINLDAVRYFDYLLEKSNVGQLLLRNDMAGGYSYQLNANDWQRYNDLFESLNNSGFIGNAQTFGNVTLFDVNNYLPLVYTNSPLDVYDVNNYASILNTVNVAPRMAILGSLNNYNVSYDYVAGTTGITNGDVYVPLIANQYLIQVQNDLDAELQHPVADKVAIAQLNQTIQELTNLISSSSYNSIDYYDTIQQAGLFNIMLNIRDSTMLPDVIVQGIPVSRFNNGTWGIEFKSGTKIYSSLDQICSDNSLDTTFRQNIVSAVNPYSYEQLLLGNQAVTISNLTWVGNSWYKVGSVQLNAGTLGIHTDFSPEGQVTFNSGTQNELPTSIVVWNTTLNRSSNGAWSINLPSGDWTYTDLVQLFSDTHLDANFRHAVAQALNVSFTQTDPDMALVSTNSQQDSYSTPSIVFQQIQPGKLLVNVQNASQSFFLNYLESYQKHWKVYVIPNNSLENAQIAREDAGSTELTSASSPLPDSYDLTAISGKSVLDNNHYLLNGFANSWYVNLNQLSKQNLIAESNGTYSFTLLIYFNPQANFVMGIYLSVGAGVFACVLVSYLICNNWLRLRKLKGKILL